MERVELNISFCTFKLENIQELMQILEAEQEKAIHDLKIIYEQYFDDDNVPAESTVNWKRDIALKIKKREEVFHNRGSIEELLGKYAALSFSITMGDKTQTTDGSKWLDLLNRTKMSVSAIRIKFECNILRRRIILNIREHSGLVGTFDNKYLIQGDDPIWVDNIVSAFDRIIKTCNNKRKNLYEMGFILELIFSIILAGSLFSLIRICMFVLDQNYLISFTNSITSFLLGSLLYIVVWIFIAIPVATRLFEYVTELYPSIEIFLNERRMNKRKKLFYAVIMMGIPYILYFF